MRHTARLITVLGVALALAAGCSNGTGPEPTPEGPFEFVSADGYEGQSADFGGAVDAGASAEADRAGDGASERTVEEGDIYRMLDDHTLLNLNSYRGLQVIDLSDLSDPKIIGRLQVSGTPVELYVTDDRAVVLLNNWRGYYGSRDDVRVEQVEGGLVMTVDLADRADPTMIDHAPVPGWIRTSRLAREGSHASLYAATSHWGEYENASGDLEWQTRTFVKSFDVSDGPIAERDLLDLGGYVQDIQATPYALLVARYDWSGRSDRSLITVVDISDAQGRMIEGDEVEVQGRINNQFNMDLHGDVLRVVSGSRWGGGNTNHVETFDASDLSALTSIDHCTFGDNEDLYATLFLGNKAFFVTYFRVDPFHAFSISDEGICEEQSEFIVSGWNDFFRPVFDETRLMGIGVDDADGSRTMAVSLYDITDLTNASPLIARAEVEAEHSWSEAQWDHRAFSVIEDAVEVSTAGGTTETGLVLLPFQGWDDSSRTSTAGVQIYSFSADTLTRRGMMDHGSAVRRSFEPSTGVAANLSESELSLFDSSSPDAPDELGRVELAPSFSRVLRYGDHYVRVHDPSSWYGYYGDREASPMSTLEVLLDSEHPDQGAPVASIEVPAGSQIHQVGDKLVAIRSEATDTTEWPYTYESTVRVYDLSNPVSPSLAGELVTDRLQPFYGGGYYYGGIAEDCFDCGRGGYYYGGYHDDMVRVVDDAIVFTRAEQQRELLGTERVCNTYPNRYERCEDGADSCTYYEGGINCRTLEGEAEVCTGEIVECTYTRDTEDWSCAEVSIDDVPTETRCHDNERYRYWTSYALDVLDLRADEPRLAPVIELPDDDEAVGLLAGDGAVYYSYQRPVDVAGDARPFVTFFFRRIGLDNPLAPSIGRAVNVPGQLLAVEGSALITRDLRWGESVAETLIHRLELRGDRAYLGSSYRFEDRMVQTVRLDGAGHVLVSHNPVYSYRWYETMSEEERLTKLTILDQADVSMRLNELDVDSWATFSDAQGGKALFQAPGGILVFDVKNPATAAAQAYFPIRGWPSGMLFDGDEILFAAGPYGIYQFDANTRNLWER